MFERFTSRARQVLVLAEQEAARLGHTLVGSEHILLGLVEEGTGIGARTLVALGVSADVLRKKVVEHSGTPVAAVSGGNAPFAPGAKKVLEAALQEAVFAGHNYIGTEHLLLGVVRDTDNPGARALAAAGLDPGAVRAKVFELLASVGVPARASTTRSPAVAKAIGKAEAAAGTNGIVTTAALVRAIVSDEHSHGAQALRTLGVTPENVAAALASIAVEDTNDSPGPQAIEIKLGQTSTVFADPDLATALARLPQEQLLAALRDIAAKTKTPPGSAAPTHTPDVVDPSG
jgi:ATP-dependent Clp protease ATP-binding subunit ClpA